MYYYVYAFVLTDEKYYIAHSVTELEKPCTFFSLSEDVWLQKYPIRDIDYHVRTSDIYDIDKLVVQYMDRYGAYNVRGGSFSFDALRSGTLYPFLATMSKRSTGCFYAVVMCIDMMIATCTIRTTTIAIMFLHRKKKTTKTLTTTTAPVMTTTTKVFGKTRNI